MIPGGGRAIVTGGSTGTSAAIVAGLSTDGVAVHVIDIEPPRTGPNVSSTTADIASEAEVTDRNPDAIRQATPIRPRWEPS